MLFCLLTVMIQSFPLCIVEEKPLTEQMTAQETDFNKMCNSVLTLLHTVLESKCSTDIDVGHRQAHIAQPMTTDK